MRAAIQRARDILSDPAVRIGEKIGIVGILAIALIAHDFSGAEAEDAREIVVSFWREMDVAQ